MKRTFGATVVGVTPTDTGAHSVEFDVREEVSPRPFGGPVRRVELPMFNAADARDLAAMYQSVEAVKITFQVGEPEGNSEPEARGPDRFAESGAAQRRALRVAIMRTVTLLQNAVSGRMPSVNACHSLCVELGSASDAAFGGNSEPPPTVNGKPSCCEPVRGSGIRIAALDFSSRYGWAIGAHTGVEYCLYCGTKLPALDGTPS